MKTWRKVKIYKYVSAPTYFEAVKAFQKLEETKELGKHLVYDGVKEDVEPTPKKKGWVATLISQITG
jgi:hypothetical protein